MKKLKDEYNSFLNDMQKNIKNKEYLNYIKSRFEKLTDIISDYFEIYEYKENKRLNSIEEKQNNMINQLNEIENRLDKFQNEFYSEGDFDIEIICPYCDYEFIADINEENEEVKCPNCNNIIELDWTADIYGEEDNNDFRGCPGCGGCQKFDEDDEM